MTNNIQGNSHQAISWFLNRNFISQKGMAWYIWNDEREEPTIKDILPSKTFLQIWWRNQKLSRQAKVKRIQQHQTSFTTNAKGVSLDKKHKERKDLQKQTQNNNVNGNRIIYIKNYLNGNGLNAPIKRYTLAEWIQK